MSSKDQEGGGSPSASSNDGDSSRSGEKPISETLKSYARSFAGALVFAIPAVYTMEIWWRGYIPSAERLLGLLIATYLLLWLFNYFSSLHREQSSWFEAAGQAFESLLIGFSTTVAALYLIEMMPPVSATREWIGKVISEGLPVSVGVAVGSSQFGSRGEGQKPSQKRSLLHRMSFGALGAVLVAAALAPTEEIVLLAYRLPPTHLLLILGLSLVFCFAVGAVVDRVQPAQHSDYAGGLVGAALVAYLAGTFTAVVLLLLGGLLTSWGPHAAIASIIVVGLPCCVGASAGKALLS